jgi:hypothetical protein
LDAGGDRLVTVRTSGRGEVGFVVAARMTEGARHVVVLDGAPPYVKVYGHDGGLHAAFMRKGGGPGELEAPAALATSGDTAILVADARGGLSVFDLEGRLKQHTPSLGIVPLAAAAGCDGGWMLYGPLVAGAAAPAWLHDVRLAAGGAEVHSSLRDSLPEKGIGIGLAYGLVGDGRTLVLRHDAGSAVYARRCGTAAPRLVFRTNAARAGREVGQAGEGRQITHVARGTRMLAGMAEVAGGVVLADVFAGGGTELVLHAPGRTATRRLSGAWFLRDSGPGGVLVSTDDPEPRLFVLRPAAFERLFARR